MSKFVNSSVLVDLINPEYKDRPEELLYKFIYPYEYIPEIVEEASTFLLFDLDVDLNKHNSIINNFTLYVYPIVHVDAMRTPRGLRSDLMVVEIEKIFKGQNVLGIGEMKLMYNHKYHAGRDFRGRALCFRIFDFVSGPKLVK